MMQKFRYDYTCVYLDLNLRSQFTGTFELVADLGREGSAIGPGELELEFREDLQQMQQATMAMQQNPQMQMQPSPEMQQAQVQMQVTQRKIDARKAVLIAEYTGVHKITFLPEITYN